MRPGLLIKNDPHKKVILHDGLRIHVEWLKGSIRSYKNSDFKKLMHADYGYIHDTTSRDGEDIDVYVGSDQVTEKVYKIKQLKSEYEAEKQGGTAYESFDEWKYMLFFPSAKAAKDCYIKCMDKKLFGGIDEMSWSTFKGIVTRSRPKELSKGVQLKEKPEYKETNMDDGKIELWLKAKTSSIIIPHKDFTPKKPKINLNPFKAKKESPDTIMPLSADLTKNQHDDLKIKKGKTVERNFDPKTHYINRDGKVTKKVPAAQRIEQLSSHDQVEHAKNPEIELKDPDLNPKGHEGGPVKVFKLEKSAQEANMIEYRDGNSEIGYQLLVKNATDRAELIKTNFMEEFTYEETPSQELFKGWSEDQEYGEYLSKRRGNMVKDAPIYKMADLEPIEVSPELIALYKGDTFGIPSEGEFDLVDFVKNSQLSEFEGSPVAQQDADHRALAKMAELYNEVWTPLLKKVAEELEEKEKKKDEDLEDVEVDLDGEDEDTPEDDTIDEAADKEDKVDFKKELHKGLTDRGVVDVNKVERIFIKMLLEGGESELQKKYASFSKLVSRLKKSTEMTSDQKPQVVNGNPVAKKFDSKSNTKATIIHRAPTKKKGISESVLSDEEKYFFSPKNPDNKGFRKSFDALLERFDGLQKDYQHTTKPKGRPVGSKNAVVKPEVEKIEEQREV